MVGEERALIQAAPTKRQRKWNQESDKGNGTDMGCYFFKYFYFISRYALANSFLSYILLVYCKKSRSWWQGPPTAERKRQRKLSGHRPTRLCCYFYNYFCFISLYALVNSSFWLTFYFSNAKKSRSWSRGLLTAGPPAMAQLAPWVIRPGAGERQSTPGRGTT